VAAAFDRPLAEAGAAVLRTRLAWVEAWGPRWAAACADLGEPLAVGLEYRGRPDLADEAAWPPRLADTLARDLATGATGTGPHRDDLLLRLRGAPLREAGSTGQQRTAAVALKLCERDTLRAGTGQTPALLLDDVFAELDRERQERLARQLAAAGGSQVFVTSPRRDEMPPGLPLPVYAVREGRVVHDASGRAVA
jgi:DNA replication and repair protein RecF